MNERTGRRPRSHLLVCCEFVGRRCMLRSRSRTVLQGQGTDRYFPPPSVARRHSGHAAELGRTSPLSLSHGCSSLSSNPLPREKCSTTLRPSLVSAGLRGFDAIDRSPQSLGNTEQAHV